MRFQSDNRTDIGCRRKVNEDALLDRPERGLWAVADGMGGHEAGDVASALVVEALEEADLPDGLPGALSEAKRALELANTNMFESTSGAKCRKMGSTAVGLIITGDAQYACFWVGDSRGFLVREGRIEQITRDHSLVQRLLDSKLITAEEAATHPDASVITRAVGAAESLDVDHVEGTARSRDIFVLASDGLTRCVEENEILHAVTTGNPRQACNDLVDLVLERGAPDNVSIVVVRVV